MSKALFVCYGGGHADALIPVIHYLRANTDINVEAIGVNLAAEKLRKAGIPCKSLSDYLDIRSVEIGFPLARGRHNFSSKVSFADSIAYYGYTMSDLIDEVGEDIAYKILKIFDRRTMFPAKTMMRILDQERPDVVITTTMNRFEAATLYAAGKLGIATVKVEDLIGRIYKTFPDKIQVDTEEEKKRLIKNGISEKNIILKEEINNPLVMDFYEKIYSIQNKMRPTAFAVLCEYAKNEIMKRGVPENQIYITGQPAFDKHPWYLINTSKEDVCKKLGIDANKKLVSFMSQPNVEREEVFKAFVDAINFSEVEDVYFIVKLHPNEDGKIQKLLLKEKDIDNVILVKDIDARELIAVSEVIMTVSSTTGLEAAVMGKPLIYVNVTATEDFIPFEKMGIGIRCQNSKEIAEELNKYFIQREKFDLPMIKKYRTDGKAAERVGRIIENLADKKMPASKRTVIIIQARMGSTRLPGKVLKLLAGKPQVQHVVDRMGESRLASEVVVATSSKDNNKLLIEYLGKNQINYCIGSEANVLYRYIDAAEKFNADIVVRVTADNPLTSAKCIDRMIESHIQMNADYTVMKGLPIGITGEVVNLDALRKVKMSSDVTEHDLEHVTSYIYEHPEQFILNYMKAPKELNYPKLHLTVDTQEDFNKMSFIYEQLYNGGYIDVKDVIDLVINKMEKI